MTLYRRILGIAPVAAAMLVSSAFATSWKEVPELGKFFTERQVVGTFVLFDAGADTMFVWNKERAEKRFIPASTFKIANSLIGLEVGAVKDADEGPPYGGQPQWVKAWEKDMSLRDAIKISNVAIYRELARRIGLERMREGVRKLGYGNMEIGDVVDIFWLDGPLAISAAEQTRFLDRLTSGKLPVKPAVVKTVEEMILLEQTGGYELHAKTGWYADKGKQSIGWWVGWVKRDGKIFPFALNFDMNSAEDAEKRIPIGRDCLKILGKM